MPAPKTALEGIRVLDLGRYQAGPRAGLIMARMGAEVIKIEPPGGEESRGGGSAGAVRGQNPYWVQYNSSKKSLAVDLRQEAGKQILRDLVKISDVFIQSFRPGTIDEMGFGYEKLKAMNNRIVMLNVSAYGQYGPYKDRIGFDPIGQAISGMMALTGFADAPPTVEAMPVIDRITALHGTIGILAALREREISGEGQAIDVCLADTGFSMTEIPITHYLESGVVPQREGNRVASSLQNTYRTNDGWVLIVGSNPNIWERICRLLEKTDWLTDPRFVERGKRRQHADIIEAEFTRWFAGKSTEVAVKIFSEAGIPCSAVNDIPNAAKSPQIWERELLVKVPDPAAGSIHVSGKFIKMSRSRDVVGAAPAVGEHTDEVLREVLKYSPAQIKNMRAAKTVA